MLIHRRQYHNLMAEPIRLDIYRFTNCCQLVVSRSQSRIDVVLLFGLLVLTMAIVSSSYNINKLLDRLVMTSISSVLVIALVYWRTPVYRESLLVLDNMSGLEVTQYYSLLGLLTIKRSQFILSAAIIINEAITMHRVIYYLVSIPLSLSNTLLMDSSTVDPLLQQSSDDFRRRRLFTHQTSNHIKSNTSTNNNMKHNCTNGLIPLFSHTCPRIDCLKVMYKHINDFKTNTTTNRLLLYKPNDTLLSVIKPLFKTISYNNNHRNGLKM
ncbi:uncharacterized protein LOC128953436 [Oppia nitens]|uniref:uncharacterized protein LOC128953436 n=1 Tax=Oppia nitens TaxID=1686743 RepID=UPI0023DA444C|nr:uncharacterized protein LOC128953436 [Oppia nitens]